jgi:regulator of sigma E protease
MSVVYFLLLVGVLVVIHELGHFVAAKILDVKVLRFSIGYGRPLVRVKARAAGESSYTSPTTAAGSSVWPAKNTK